MGRKSLKAKEKKMKRKEENARIAAKQSLVDAANEMEDPMVNLLPFKKFERNGLSVNIQCLRACDVDKELMDWAFELTKKNMQTLYEASDWGWNDKQKKDEMLEDQARYLIATTTEDQVPVAAVHFRFDLDNDDEVLYCYEIQLEKETRRKGLGKFLMQILELLAHKTHMTKVMLTVLTNNNNAEEFFVEALNSRWTRPVQRCRWRNRCLKTRDTATRS